MILVVRMRSDTDGPNRLPGTSRLTLLRSNTGMLSVGFTVAWRCSRVFEALAVPEALCACLRLRIRVPDARPGGVLEARIACVTDGDRCSRLNAGEAARVSAVLAGRLHVAPLCDTRRVSTETDRRARPAIAPSAFRLSDRYA
ncbi:unnamed protein product [Euphydryas editha]|uniref:Uncharacterized protein n=1 Tax=Euphydryas editha TaxID=104508 RepID=A0AAU9UE10_EUPED|nr:unnamed protein product [Euphydryas editha]